MRVLHELLPSTQEQDMVAGASQLQDGSSSHVDGSHHAPRRLCAVAFGSVEGPASMEACLTCS